MYDNKLDEVFVPNLFWWCLQIKVQQFCIKELIKLDIQLQIETFID